MARAYPGVIGPIREVRHTLSQLKLHDLAVGQDGRNRCLLSAFRARTGRNQPSNTAYIFGPSCWLRSLIKPAARVGRGVCGLEPAGACHCRRVFSQDQAMMDAYQSGDFYSRLPRWPEPRHRTRRKTTHAAVREQFKVVSLGVLYGLSEQGIARRLGVPPVPGTAPAPAAQGGVSHLLGLGRPRRDAGHARGALADRLRLAGPRRGGGQPAQPAEPPMLRCGQLCLSIHE